MKLKLCNNGLSVVGANEKGMFMSYSIEAEEYKQWLEEGNTPEPEFTEAEITQQELEAKIAEARAYLQATDYVAVKYNDEVTVTGSMTKTAFLAKYADVYAQRAEARAIVSGGE